MRARGDLNALVHDYIANKFSRQIEHGSQHEYKLTTAISRKLIGDGTTLSGILYPTIAMNGNGDNVVLTKRAADELLKLVSVEFIYVKSRNGMQFEVEILDSATKTDILGALNWSGRGLLWEVPPKSELKMVTNGLEWVALNKSGERIDPL